MQRTHGEDIINELLNFVQSFCQCAARRFLLTPGNDHLFYGMLYFVHAPEPALMYVRRAYGEVLLWGSLRGHVGHMFFLLSLICRCEQETSLDRPLCLVGAQKTARPSHFSELSVLVVSVSWSSRFLPVIRSLALDNSLS